MERSLEHNAFMFGALDKANERLPNGVKKEFLRIFECFEASISKPEPLPVQPIYSADGLLLAAQGATDGFQRAWRARLGLGSHEAIKKEHWTRVKALNRRLAEELDVEYDSLRPLADLVALLGEEVARYLDNPTRWTSDQPNEEEVDRALSAIRQTVYARLHDLAERKLLQEHLDDWRIAYRHRGTGSTRVRAQEIDGIYRHAAPVPQSVMPPEAISFLSEFRRMVKTAIEDQGGKMVVAGE